MATRNVVPRDDLEGKLGTGEKRWEAVYAGNISVLYNTVADMKADTNLKAGAFAQTLGYRSINDGGTSVYKIRVKTVDDVSDNGSVIVLNDANLVAELVPINGTVNVKQFGAYGNGTIEDTDFIQDTINFAQKTNLKVVFPHALYRTKIITVTKNIEIDLCNSEILALQDEFIMASGEIVASLLNENDYTHNQSNYSISDPAYANYTGFAFLHGENNFNPNRSYYVGGFVCQFENGQLIGTYPVDVNTNVVLDIINPITVKIMNLGDITHVNAGDGSSSVYIRITYGINCIIDGGSFSSDGHYGIMFFSSINCCAKHINVIQSRDNTYHTYPIAFMESCFCGITDSQIYNKYWHCGTTGGYHLCYMSYIKNCSLISVTQYAFCDHGNAYGTSVKDTRVTAIYLAGGALIDNVNICCSNYPSSVWGLISISPTPIEQNAVYTIKNVVFEPYYGNTDPDNFGIKLYAAEPQVGGNTCYFTKVTIDNVFSKVLDSTNKPAKIWFGLNSQNSYVLKNFYISNINLTMDLGFSSSDISNYVDISNYKLLLSNCYRSFNRTIFGDSSKYHNYCMLSNCEFYEIHGHFAWLEFNSLRISHSFGVDFYADKFYGTGLFSIIPNNFNNFDVIESFPDISISDFPYRTSTNRCFNLITKDDNIYFSEFDSVSKDFVIQKIVRQHASS